MQDHSNHPLAEWPDNYREVDLDHVTAVRFLAEASAAYHAALKTSSEIEILLAEQRLDAAFERVSAGVAAVQLLPRAYLDRL